MAKAKETRKKAAYRKRNQNRFSMVLVIIVISLITIVVAIRSAELHQRLDEYKTKEADLRDQIAQEELRAEEIELFRKYTQTAGYIEEIAMEKLGLVYECEIVFQEED